MAIVEVQLKEKIKYKVVWYNEFGVQKSKLVDSKREANNLDKKMKAEKTLDLLKTEPDVKFSKYAADFMMVHTDDLKDTTKHNYEMYIKLLNEKFGDMRIVDITPILLDKYFLNLKKVKKLKINTIKKYRDVLKLILKDAYKKDIIAANPIDKLAFKFTSDEEEPNKLVSFAELKRLMDTFQVPYYRHFILLGYYTGMRKGELLALTWDNIDFENKLIFVKNNLNMFGEVTTPKTKKSIRSILIHDILEELLCEIQTYQDEMRRFFGEHYHDNNLVICKQDGEYLNSHTVTRTFNDKNKIYGFDITPHKLRHTFASLLDDANQSDLRELLGHSSQNMTNHYQHHISFKDETLNKLNTVFKSN